MGEESTSTPGGSRSVSFVAGQRGGGLQGRPWCQVIAQHAESTPTKVTNYSRLFLAVGTRAQWESQATVRVLVRYTGPVTISPRLAPGRLLSLSKSTERNRSTTHSEYQIGPRAESVPTPTPTAVMTSSSSFSSWSQVDGVVDGGASMVSAMSLHPYTLFSLDDSPQTFALSERAQKRRRISVDRFEAVPIVADVLASSWMMEATAASAPSPAGSAASRLSMDLIKHILDYALLSIDLGSNGRWASLNDVGSSKAQWAKSNKASALIHRKLSLIHRTWTPHVLRSLYHTPRLTSRRSIEAFAWCLSHPEDLWGYDGNPVKLEGSMGAGLGTGLDGSMMDVWGMGGGDTSSSSGTGWTENGTKVMEGENASPQSNASINSNRMPYDQADFQLGKRTRSASAAGPPMHETVLSVLAKGWDTPVPACSVPDRRRLVKYLGFNVGMGRHSSGDYILYSGDWFARVAIWIARSIPDLWGYETECWCALGCDELVRCCTLSEYKHVHPTIRRWSLVRNPAQANMIRAVAEIQPNLSVVEWMDLGSHILEPGPSGWDALVGTMRLYQETLRVFSCRIRGTIEVVGVFDRVFEILPRLHTLMIQADLISFGLFDQPPAEDLHTLLIGVASGPPLLFRGRNVVEALWAHVSSRLADGLEEVAGSLTSAAPGMSDVSSEPTSDIGPANHVRSHSPGWEWIHHGVSIIRASGQDVDKSLANGENGLSVEHERTSSDSSISTVGSHWTGHDLVERSGPSSSSGSVPPESSTRPAEAPPLAPVPVRPFEIWLQRQCAEGGSLRQYVASGSETMRVIEGMCW